MVDDDLIPPNINKAVLPWGEVFQAFLHHGDLIGRHELGHDLTEEDLGVGVLVDFVAFGEGTDEFAIGFGGELVPRLAGLGLASVQVVGVSFAVDVGHGHGGTSISLSGWSHFSVTSLMNFMNHAFLNPIGHPRAVAGSDLVHLSRAD